MHLFIYMQNHSIGKVWANISQNVLMSYWRVLISDIRLGHNGNTLSISSPNTISSKGYFQICSTK